MALNLILVLCPISVLGALMLYLLYWRKFTLTYKYALWQKEAQEIEVATHSALYSQQYLDSPVYPTISIIVPVKNDSERLEYLLTQLLSQDYSGKFEIIVIDQLSTDNTKDVVMRLQTSHSQLRFIALPSSTRYITKRKLAITLGVKASYGEWCLVLNATTIPCSKHWLQRYSENLSGAVDFVQAYYNFDIEFSMLRRYAAIERIYDFIKKLCAFEHNRILGCGTANYAVRKSWFLKEKGFVDSLKLPFGEEALFAYFHCSVDRTLFLCSPDTKLQEILPDSKTLKYNRIAQSEVLRYFGKDGIKTRANELLHALILYAWVTASTIYLVLRLYHDFTLQSYTNSCAASDIIYLLSNGFILHRLKFNLHKCMTALGEPQLSWINILIYELISPFRHLFIKMLCLRLRKHFVRKFI